MESKKKKKKEREREADLPDQQNEVLPQKSGKFTISIQFKSKVLFIYIIRIQISKRILFRPSTVW